MISNDSLAQQLVDGLTSEQVADVLAKLLERVTEAERAAFGTTLEPDAASVFRRLLAPPAEEPVDGVTEADGVTSDAKFEEQFRGAVRALECLFLELGDEEGDYVCQEHDWEPPDFDAYQLEKDIERCAGDLLPLLERAAALELAEQDLFLDLCRQISDGVDMYPDHIYTDDGVCFDVTATECVLTWLDLHVDSEANFLDGLLTFMNEAGCVSLQDVGIRAYLVNRWPEGRRRALYQAIQARRSADDGFRQETDRPCTLWHGIRYSLSAQFDVAGMTRIAEASVSEDWSMGVGLVDAAVAEGDSARALEFCRKTVDAYYRPRARLRSSSPFDPANTPLLGHWGVPDESPTLSRILRLWAELAAAEGDSALSEQLTVQEALFARADDWTAVRSAFARADTADTSVLFGAWKKQTLDRQHRGGFVGDATYDPVWPEWLLDAGFADRFDAFTEKVSAWMAQKVKGDGQTTRGALRPAWQARFRWPAQMSLATDLFALRPDTGTYPELRTALAEHCKLYDCPSRREWLGKTDVDRLTGDAVEFARRNMARLIPSPGEMGGNYETAAAWLSVAREITPALADNTLRHWQVEYKRRRNLWRDLRARGFQV